jgi:eukaryotic-like serine/threonine-protein kinase
MEGDRTNRPKHDMPTQFGSAAAVSSGSGDTRPVERPDSEDAPTSAGVGPASPAVPGTASRMHQVTSFSVAHSADQALEAGTVLGSRYEILQVLGEGGMGSVYKAKDLELDRLVALKVIRPELARNPAIVERFKQELRLSHQVTHKNVVRMYDLAESDGIKFITMEYIEGRDLRSLIHEKQKLSPAETVEILQQVCRALESAHHAGIIHRDLKPQNIMLDQSGRIVLMDFGLARTILGEGMTQTGALVGTMDYMSPEQALGKELDERSDIFALGLIFYELLTGKMPFKADSALASLIKRTQERAAPVSSHDPAIPPTLSGIVSKCLERDAALRYKNVGEVLEALEIWQGKRAATSLAFNANLESSGISSKWLWLAAAVVVVILAVSGFVLKDRLFKARGSSASGPVISLAIMPFFNASGDPSLDWLSSSLSDMLSGDVGQSSRLRMVSPDRLHQVLKDLHISGHSRIDVATLRRLAEFTNADTVVYGQYSKVGDQIRIDTTVLNLRQDSSFVLKTDVPTEQEILGAVDRLAGDVRQHLAATPEILKELQAHSLRPSTDSVKALRDYDVGLQLARQGINLAAVKEFEDATTEDPTFALAYSKLGEIYSNLGHDDLAEKASRRAVELSDNLPAQEKYRIEASHARITQDPQKAIAAYELLAKENPADTDVQLALAGLYERTSNFPEAKKHLAMVLAQDPKYVDALLASGRVEIKSGNTQGGLDYLSRAQSLAIQLDNQEEKAAILQATGIAYSILNKPEDALRNFQESLAIKKQIGDKRGMAASLEEIASIQDATGHPEAALASYKESLATRKEIGDKQGIGNTLIDTGSFYHDHDKPDEALKYYNDALQIERDLGDESNQALCLNNIGTIRLDRGDYQDALTYLDQAYQLRNKLGVSGDIAGSLHNLAEANSKLGQYDAALAQYLKALETWRSINDQRNVALESESMAKLFAAQGRYGAALAAMQEALKIFQQSKESTSFTVEIVGGWGDLLAQVGRGDEGHASIEEAINVARQINNDAITSLATNWLGDEYFYKGDSNSARQQYDQALQIASKTSDRERTLISKINKAKTDVSQGHATAAIASLRRLSEDADTLGLKSLSVECSVYLGAGLLATKDVQGAHRELDRALARAEKLGLRVMQAKSHYYLASLLAQTGDKKAATPHYREVVRTLESISKEEGSARVIERADLHEIYRDSMSGFQGSD